MSRNSLRSPLVLLILASLFVLASNGTAAAHFVWLQIVDGKVRVVFGEGLEPDKAEFLNRLGKLECRVLEDGKWRAVSLSKQTEGDIGWLQSELPSLCMESTAACEYGLFQRGEQTMWLHYGARYWRVDRPMQLPAEQLPLDLQARVVDGKWELKGCFDGVAIPGSSIVVVAPNGEKQELVADAEGVARMEAPSGGVWRLRVAKSVPEAGTFEGTEYSERKYHCTLVIDAGEQVVTAESAPAVVAFPDLPMGLTSFGAALAGRDVYAFGGQMGSAHSYARSYQNGKLLRLNLDSAKEWETVAETTGAQGLALVAHAGRVFRLGGFEARNEEGAEQDLHSLDVFSSLDPAAGSEWKDLPAMPEPRSSFDACMIGDAVYVAGGWNMSGAEETVWSATALRFDLSAAEGKWEALPEPPFRRRAVAVSHHDNRLYVVGGMDESGTPSRKVDIFDLNSQSWTAGPDLPEDGKMEGFGSAAVNVNGRLVVSTYGGSFYQLSDDGASWNKFDQLEAARFFHRLVPSGEVEVLMIGGANMESGHQKSVEVISVGKQR